MCLRTARMEGERPAAPGAPACGVDFIYETKAVQWAAVEILLANDLPAASYSSGFGPVLWGLAMEPGSRVAIIAFSAINGVAIPRWEEALVAWPRLDPPSTAPRRRPFIPHQTCALPGEVVGRLTQSVRVGKGGICQKLRAWRKPSMELVMKFHNLTACQIATFCAVAVVQPAQAATGKRCESVQGVYSIFANNDALQIRGSNHFLEVSSNDLDAKLQNAGWETQSVTGRFLICGPSARKAIDWKIHDRVRLISVTEARITPRKSRLWL